MYNKWWIRAMANSIGCDPHPTFVYDIALVRTIFLNFEFFFFFCICICICVSAQSSTITYHRSIWDRFFSDFRGKQYLS